MSENRYKNISKIGEMIGEKSLSGLISQIGGSEKDVFALIKNITEKEKEIELRNQELARAAQEQSAASKTAAAAAEETAPPDVAAAPEQSPPQKESAAKPAAKTQSPADTGAKAQEVAAKTTAAPETGSAEVKESKAADKDAAKDTAATAAATAVASPQKEDAKTAGEQIAKPAASKTDAQGARTYAPKTDAPRADSQGGKTYPPRTDAQSGRTYAPRTDAQSGRTYAPRTDAQSGRTYPPRTDAQSGRTYAPRTDAQSGRTYAPRADGQRSYTPDGQRQYVPGGRNYGGAASGARASYTPNKDAPARRPGDAAARPPFKAKPATAAIPPAAPAKQFGNKRKSTEKNYDDKKNTVSKRSLIKQTVSVEDFDENKSGYRKLRTKKQKIQQQNSIIIEKSVINTEIVPLKVLSEKIGVSAVEITKILFKENIFKTINDVIDFATAELVAATLGIELELKLEKTAEEVLTDVYKANEDESKLKPRPPVVTVMGHVDHGKTSLLDRLRKTNVTAGEAGGITQHIGAYTVSLNGKKITFIDTPGHSAFTSMRARGAQVTDIAIIVIAADDGIMPQTVEAINHAKAAGVSIIVAVNKIDKPDSNIERIKQQMTDNNLVPEEWGGDVIVCPVSAKTGEGIEKLLENINLLAELKELRADPDAMAIGVVIEAKLDKGMGPVASVLIQNGTLKTGESVLSGTTYGRVRAMTDDKGKTVKSAGPSTAVSILGLEEVPRAGDIFHAVDAAEQGKLIKSVAAERKSRERESMIKNLSAVTLDDVFGKIAEDKVKGFNIVLKADVQGTVEAVKQSLEKLSDDEVRVNVIHAAAGAINESDVMLAETSKAIIIGFNVRCDVKSKTVAERSGVDVRTYRVIYELLDDIDMARKGMLEPKYREEMTGKCEVRNTFKITGVGMVAGCYVTDGKLVRNGKLRIYRDDVLIVEGDVKQLKRFKDDVKEVASGYECGLSIENFNDIKVGDIIECYIREEIKR